MNCIRQYRSMAPHAIVDQPNLTDIKTVSPDERHATSVLDLGAVQFLPAYNLVQPWLTLHSPSRLIRIK